MHRRWLHYTKTLFQLSYCIGTFLCAPHAAKSQPVQTVMPSHGKPSKTFADSSIKIISNISEAMALPKRYVFTGFKNFTCKGAMFYFKDTSRAMLEIAPLVLPSLKQELPTVLKKPFITVHGNVMYNLMYRSYIDTPFAAEDVYQHTVQSYLDITVKDNYPVRLYFTTNFGNTPLFKNFTNLNFQFNSTSFQQLLRDKIKNIAIAELSKRDTLNKLKAMMDEKFRSLKETKDWIDDPGIKQKIVEARESEYLKNLLAQRGDASELDDSAASPISKKETFITEDPLNKYGEKGSVWNFVPAPSVLLGSDTTEPRLDSNKAVKNINVEYEEKTRKIDSLQKDIALYQSKYDKQKTVFQQKKDSLLLIIQSSKDIHTLTEKLGTLNLPDSALPKGYKKLLAVRSLGIGTLPVNYSELTIKNISLTGVQIEYNPSYYAAFATGFISYRFRDYILNQGQQPKQYVTALRFGMGRPESNSIIMTYYTGKKYLYNYSTSIDSQTMEPKYNIIGVSILGRYQLDKNNFITGELAKSSLPYYSNSPDKDNLLSSTFKLNDHSNQAWSLTASSIIPSTQTKISGNYRKTGNNFQSYSLFTTSSSQSAWYIKADQQLFKRKLSINASLRKNDFNNPYISQSFSSTAVFKSIQATLRIKKLPVVTVGYFPSSQITKINEEQFSESLFYTFVVSAAHFYRIRETMMNTSAIFTRFYNKAADTNFVYFNTKNVSLIHGIIFKTFSLQSNLSYASNTSYSLYSAGQSLSLKINDELRLGGGMKYNHQTILADDLLGWSLNMQLKIKKLGNIDLYYDKGFIPGINKTLVSNETGRITYSRIF